MKRGVWQPLDWVDIWVSKAERGQKKNGNKRCLCSSYLSAGRIVGFEFVDDFTQTIRFETKYDQHNSYQNTQPQHRIHHIGQLFHTFVQFHSAFFHVMYVLLFLFVVVVQVAQYCSEQLLQFWF